jgi:hypothetical protein
LPPIDIQRRVIVDGVPQLSQNPERQKALEWFKENTVGGALLKSRSEELDMAIAMGASIAWHIGSDLTKSNKPYFVQWSDGRFQPTELTIEEANKKGFKKSSVHLFRRKDEAWMCN